jgi:hypothetical protein
MGAEREAEREVILDHLLAEGHLRQADCGLEATLAVGAEEGQGSWRPEGLRRPKGISTREAEEMRRRLLRRDVRACRA